MKVMRALACAGMMMFAAGCGGGGGSSSKKPVPAASVTVAITTSAISTDVIVGDDYRATVAGTWTATNLGSNQVYLQVSDSGTTFVMPAVQAANGSTFNYSLALVGEFAEGPRSGTLTVRACRDAQCAQPYANASATLNYQLKMLMPKVVVAITTAPIAETVDLGDDYRISVSGTWSPTNLGTNKVYLQVSDSGGTFTTPAVQIASADFKFSYVMPLMTGLPNTPRSGTLTVRACRDDLCTRPYADASASVNYQLQFMRIAEWETHQRNAAHNGYVPITLDPAKFAKTWEWQRPAGSEPIGGINAVATSNGSVYLTTDVYFGDAKLYALNESTGQVRWNVSFGNVPALNPPAFNDGRIYVATTGHENTFLWSFDAADGTFKFKSAFGAQWPHVLAPTAYEGEVYTNGGYFGGYVYAYDRLSGAPLWQAGAGDDDMSTPAVDSNNVYHHSGTALLIWNRMTGEQVANIPDPFGIPTGYSYHSAPILGGRSNVVAFAGSAFSGRASANVEQYEQRVLSSFNIGAKIWEWSTANAYLTQPALANGVIYAGRNRPMSLDAIDETTGKILWSWTPPAGQTDTEFHRNIVVTRNLLFVSTDQAVYAIDLATRQSVWRYPVPGMLAISANRTLYIAAGARESNGKLIAIRLK
jgi:outer membrane protein assembly factor BamB